MQSSNKKDVKFSPKNYDRDLERAKDEYRNSPDNSREQLKAMRDIIELQKNHYCQN